VRPALLKPLRRASCEDKSTAIVWEPRSIRGAIEYQVTLGAADPANVVMTRSQSPYEDP
jgi:hypothetical protein